ncbi:MAG: hypothetical protein M0R33_07210 [Methylomonas sp.]|jgi:hypothetical protein|uniref:DUF7338 family protein n=1 Tax=Methylomonas sp. TaxID=418 RepID=UPI0025FCA3A5|nr:hypothetical protein [Methylomonas sp.]MCK9606226.1 hypothetical protein [Methylomonas sp.]
MLILRILQWLLLLPIHLLITLARYPLAPVAVLLFSRKDKRHLRWPFRWLETIDNDLSGDDGWKTEHIKLGSAPLSTWNRIQWLWRNGGNRANYMLLGCIEEFAWTIRHFAAENSKPFWVDPHGYWLLRRFIRIGRKEIEVFIGWSLFGAKLGRCKYTATIRIKTSAE